MRFVSGPPVVGADFIGRETDIETLNEAILEGRNWSVVGLPRIGKTSLVDETLLRHATDYETQGIVFLRSAVARGRGWEETLFSEFANLLKQLTRNSGDYRLNQDLDGLLDDIQGYRAKEDSWISFCKNLMAHLRNTKIIIVIDEFDFAPQYFYIDLMLWRRLISIPRIRMLTISRLELGDLFPKDSGGSIFPGIFDSMSPQYLQGFSAKDLDSFHAKTGCSNEVWKYIRTQAGDVPYFLAGWSNAFLQVLKSDPIMDDLNIIALINTAYKNNFVEAARSLFILLAAKGDLVEQLFYFYNALLNNKIVDSNNCQTAQVYGIILAEKRLWRIPALRDFLDTSRQSQNDRTALEDLSQRISYQIDAAASTLRELEYDAGISANDARVHVKKMHAVMCAIHLKIKCALELDGLETDIRCFISESERNGFEQILGDWVRYYKMRFREGT